MIAPVEIAGISHLWKKDIEELTTAECLKLWMKYSHEVKYMDKMKKIREKEEKIDMLETMVEQTVNSDNEFIVLKHRVDAYYAEKQKQIDKMKAEMFEKQCEEKSISLYWNSNCEKKKTVSLYLNSNYEKKRNVNLHIQYPIYTQMDSR